MRRTGVFWIIQQFWFSSSVPLFCVIGTTKGLTCSSSFLWDPSRKNLSLQIYKSSWISLVAPPTVVSFGTTHFQTQIHQHSVTRWIKNIKRPFSYFNCSTSCLSLLHSVCWTLGRPYSRIWLATTTTQSSARIVDGRITRMLWYERPISYERLCERFSKFHSSWACVCGWCGGLALSPHSKKVLGLNACMSLCVRPVIEGGPLQGVPCHLPN